MRVIVGRRSEPTLYSLVSTKAVALLLALLVDAVIFWSLGIDPLGAYYEILRGSLLTSYGVSETIVKFIPIALCAYGLALVFKARVWNIGAEGQLLLGAILATWVALNLSENLGPLTVPVMYLAGFLAGAAWASVPALLRAKLEVNEVLTTFMLNLVAEKLLEYLIYGPWKGPGEWGFPQTAPFPSVARPPRIPGTRIHYTTLMLAIASAALLGFLERRTTFGFEIRTVGASVRTAKYAGISIPKVIALSMVISGGLAGLAGVGEVSGVQGRLRPRISPGYGYTAIVVAWLGGLNMVGVTVASFLFSALLVGGDMLQVTMRLPSAVINIFNGSILLAVVSLEFLSRYEVVVEGWRFWRR